eukprot:c10178_g1_i1.p1 GENE.c10178_g1_i1~~c10178_g1_i1.p1  ORF type:complete len:259 (-),score=66.06 c10178_g1_i1:5-781(-)
MNLTSNESYFYSPLLCSYTDPIILPQESLLCSHDNTFLDLEYTRSDSDLMSLWSAHSNQSSNNSPTWSTDQQETSDEVSCSNSINSPDSFEQQTQISDVVVNNNNNYSSVQLKFEFVNESPQSPTSTPTSPTTISNLTEFINNNYNNNTSIRPITKKSSKRRVEDPQIRISIRRQRNREIAKKSRERKKVHVQSMETQIKKFEYTLISQAHQIDDLRSENTTRKSEISILAKTLLLLVKENENLRNKLQEQNDDQQCE